MQAVVGIDIGTTGCRAVIHRIDGAILANQSLDYPLYTPHHTWAEQDPEEIFQAILIVIEKAVLQAGVRPEDIACMSFGSVFHSFIPVDKEGNALYRMMNWADQRSQSYTEELKRAHDAAAIYRNTGCPLHPMYMPSKIVWLKKERPDLFSRTYKIISIKEYVLYRFLGKYIIDRSIASGGGMYNIHKLEWDKDLLRILGVSADLFSEAVPTTHIEEGITPGIASRLNLPRSLKVVIGAGDGVLSSIGSGAVNPGQLTAMIGTSGAVRLVTDKPTVDAKGRTWCYNLTEQHWVAGGAINNGGIAFRWMRDKFAETEQRVADKLGLDAYQLLSRYAEKVPAGSNGLILLPFFAGERAPHWNANARGVLFGLNLNHDKRHIIRATLEGVTFRMFSIFKALNEVAGPVNEIRVGGSFTRSKLWVQIMADVFGKVISVPGEPEGSAFGSVILGMHALGLLRDIKEVGNFINIKERYYPIEEHHHHYQELFEIYERIYWNLQAEFSAIADIQRLRK